MFRRTAFGSAEQRVVRWGAQKVVVRAKMNVRQKIETGTRTDVLLPWLGTDRTRNLLRRSQSCVVQGDKSVIRSLLVSFFLTTSHYPTSSLSVLALRGHYLWHRTSILIALLFSSQPKTYHTCKPICRCLRFGLILNIGQTVYSFFITGSTHCSTRRTWTLPGFDIRSCRQLWKIRPDSGQTLNSDSRLVDVAGCVSLSSR